LFIVKVILAIAFLIFLSLIRLTTGSEEIEQLIFKSGHHTFSFKKDNVWAWTRRKGNTVYQPNLKLDLALDNGDIKRFNFLFINQAVNPQDRVNEFVISEELKQLFKAYLDQFGIHIYIPLSKNRFYLNCRDRAYSSTMTKYKCHLYINYSENMTVRVALDGENLIHSEEINNKLLIWLKSHEIKSIENNKS